MKVNSLVPISKDCVICIDAMSLKSHSFYNIVRDKIVRFKGTQTKLTSDTTALVITVRGITKNWEQPITYYFLEIYTKTSNLKEILLQSIRKLSLVAFNVTAVISDQGSNF